MDKCIICHQRKASRRCTITGDLICSLCCGQSRSWSKCNTECTYFPQEILNYKPENHQNAELTLMSNGETTKFEVPLFLPNIFQYIDCNVMSLQISILDFNKVRIDITFKLHPSRILGDELYNKDSWKIETSNVPMRNGKPLAPLLLVSSHPRGTSSLNNSSYNFGECSIESIKSSYSLNVWLPHSKSYKERVNVKDMPEFPGDFINAISFEGKMSQKKRDVYWGELSSKFEYKFSVNISYYELGIKPNGEIVIPFGFFLPYNKVSFSNAKISKGSGFEISDDSFVTFVLSKEEKITPLFLTPLIQNFERIYHGAFQKHLLKDIETPYHYYSEKELLYSDYFMFIKHTLNKILCSMIYESENIVSAYFNCFEELYKKKYSPINLILANTSSDIQKIKVEYEIKGLSELNVENIYIDPYKTTSIPILPKINERVSSSFTEHINIHFNIRVIIEGVIIFEESKALNLLPKETFIYDQEDDGQAVKRYFYPLLARWVTPNNTVIDEIINNAAKNIDSISGDVSNDLCQAKEEIETIYNALAIDIKYVSRTFSLFKGNTTLHQKIHLPESTYRNKCGNCIDLTMLMASCLEKINYNPLLIVIPGHAFLGIKLENGSLFVETTLLGYQPINVALEMGRKEFEECFTVDFQSKKDKQVIIDIVDARKSGIYPMN